MARIPERGFVLLFLILLVLAVDLVFGAPIEHLIDELPGQPSPVGFKQYAGYITVDEAKGTNFFYYFVEAEANASSFPLVLWLNGGPGCSSVGGGGFTELGPFYPNRSGNGLRTNPYSWNKVANLLFLESPAGVGYSYSATGDYNYHDWKVASENLVFMRKWLVRFPEYKHSQLFITGESYGGHYIPQLAWLMVISEEFNLKGILMGNPLLNFVIDTSATYSFLWSHGVISDDTYKGVSRWCDFRYGFMGKVRQLNREDNKSLIEEVTNRDMGGCTSFLGSARQEMGSYINVYDVTADVCPPPIANQGVLLHKLMGLAGDKTASTIDVCADNEVTRYLNQPSVQKALHANVTFFPYTWDPCSSIMTYRDTDQLMNISPILARLVKKQLAVWLYSGDQDSVVPLTGTRSQIQQLAQQLKLKRRGPYHPWFSNGQVGGWYEAYGDGKLLYATVRGASHMVPYAQPERALLLFSSYLKGVLLPVNP